MDTNACRLFVLSVAQAMDKGTDDNTKRPGAGRARPRGLPALGVADQVRGGQEHRPPRRQDAPRLRRLGLQARHGARALRARRQGRLGDGPDERGAAPVRRQGGPARLRGARLLEPDLQPPRGRERGQEARRGRQARAGREAARAGREGGGHASPRRPPERHGRRAARPALHHPRAEAASTRRSSRGGCGPGGATRVRGARRRPGHRRRPRRRPARRDRRARPRTGARSLGTRRPTRRRPPCWLGARASSAPRGLATRARHPPLRRRTAAGRAPGVHRPRRRDAGRRRAGRAGRRRRLAGLRAGRGDDPRRGAGARARWSCRRRSPSRGWTSASTRRPRWPTRSARASTSRSSTCRPPVLGLPRLPRPQARARRRARARPAGHAHADGHRLPDRRPALEVLRRRHGPAVPDRAGHGRPPRLVRARLHRPLLRGPGLPGPRQLHGELQPPARPVRHRAAARAGRR